MRKLIPYTALLMAVSLMFVLSACERPAGDKTASERSKTSMSDSDVEKVLKDRFNSDPQLSGTDIDVSANADNNEVKLSGTVNSEEIRDKAVQIAQNALPGFSVTDTIDVNPREMARTETEGRMEPGGGEQQGQQGMEQQRQAAKDRGDKIGNSPEDARIYSQLVGKLSSSNLPFQQIKIEVEEGVITLRGNVSNENQKTEAQKAAQQVEGVKQVNNELEVKAGQPQGQSTPTQ
jgi:osmotically-inducible protein OsmY